MKTIEFAYGIRDEVCVNAINCIGIVDSLTLDNNGPMFRVVYWDDGERNATWMYEWELKSV